MALPYVLIAINLQIIIAVKGSEDKVIYIFTPNTLIKSAEVNANYDELDARLDLLETPVYAYGTMGTETTTGYKTFTEVANSGITLTNTTTYTVVTAGLYRIYVQQLYATPVGVQLYQDINITGTNIAYGYIPASAMSDVNTSITRNLIVGDTIRIYLNCGAGVSAWGSQHSAYQIQLVDRT